MGKVNVYDTVQVDEKLADYEGRFENIESVAGLGPSSPVDGTTATLVSNPSSLTRKELNTWVNLKGFYIHPENFGAVGDGVTDDTKAINDAITAAVSRNLSVGFAAGKTYKVTSRITTTGIDVRLCGLGGRATIKTGVGISAFSISANTPYLTTTLSSGTDLGGRAWYLTSVTGVQPGDLMLVKSSRSWYFDPRAESTDARVSELHEVYSVSGNTIYTAAPSNDGYHPVSGGETVEVRFIRPIEVQVENLHLAGTLGAYGARGTTSKSQGLKIQGAYYPVIRNVHVDSHAQRGIGVHESIGVQAQDIYGSRCNDYYEGYGFQFVGCSDSTLSRAVFTGCRRGVDVSGWDIISLRIMIDKINVVGGGVNSEGRAYGWTDDANTSAYQGGMGTHGAADHVTFNNCSTTSMHDPISIRGGNIEIYNFKHIGRTRGAVITCSTGSGLHVRGLIVREGPAGLGKDRRVTQGGANFNSRRAVSAIEFHPEYDPKSRFYFSEYDVETQDRVIHFLSGAILNGDVTIGTGRARMATGTSSMPAAFFWNDGPLTTVGARWAITTPDYHRQGGTGDLSLTRNIDLYGNRITSFAPAQHTV